MAVLLGLLTALVFGTADFLGGLASRRTAAVTVVAGAQLTSALAAVLLVVLFPAPFPTGTDLALSFAAGLVNMAALGTFFRALAMGRMSVVAPLSAVVGAALPVLWGLGIGERPSPLSLSGVAIALVAVVLIARGEEAEPETGGSKALELGLSLLAGAGFGAGFLLFAGTTDDSGMWPALLSRSAGATAALLVVSIIGAPRRPSEGDTRAVVGSGALDATGMALLLTAQRSGLVSIVAPAASLYPASTVLLARLVLEERITRHQLVGLALAAVGLVVIAVG